MPERADPDPAAGHRARLRERFERCGFDGFAPHEAVELLLTLCIPRRDVKPLAKALLARFGSLRAILDAPASELRQVRGMGEVAPVAMRIIRETANLYLLQSAEEHDLLNSTTKAEAFWRGRLGGLPHEVFEVAFLDKAYRLLPGGVERLETGTLDRIAIYPRKVMEAALKRHAKHLLIAHNHPTGRPEPSKEDLHVTRALIEAGKPLEIGLIDHTIVAKEHTFSFAREGLLR